MRCTALAALALLVACNNGQGNAAAAPDAKSDAGDIELSSAPESGLGSEDAEDRVRELEGQLDDARSKARNLEMQIQQASVSAQELADAVRSANYDDWEYVMPRIRRSAEDVETEIQSAEADASSLVSDLRN